MAVKVRISRIGKKHAPVFRLVAVDSRSKRDGKSIEVLGTYDPLRHELVQFHADRIAYWVGQGAQLSEAAKRICKLAPKS